MTGEATYGAWAPEGSPWSAWVKPVLFACMTGDAASDPAGASEEAVPWAPSADSGTAVVIDVPSSRGVGLGLALARLGYQAVPLYNAAPSSGAGYPAVEEEPLVDMRAILVALQAAAPELAANPPRRGAPPAFLLDARRRGHGATASPGRFDNRSVSFTTDFPSARSLVSHGIRRGLLVQIESDEPQADLAHTLRAWQEAGIELALKRLDGSSEPGALSVTRPSRFGALWYRASMLLGMRRHPLGGFGGTIPEPSEGGGFAG